MKYIENIAGSLAGVFGGLFVFYSILVNINGFEQLATSYELRNKMSKPSISQEERTRLASLEKEVNNTSILNPLASSTFAKAQREW
jgi:hypothetical protein